MFGTRNRADPRVELERAFARRVDAAYGLSFWKGRVGFYGLLKALGLGAGHEVILPGFTCVMDVNPVLYVGATPVFVDIDASSYNLDPAKLEAKITPRTRLIVAQHTFGIPCDLDAIASIARRHAIDLVEDCCLALGSTYRGQQVGTFSRAAYWSFQWNKTITAGLGGMVTTSDAGLARELERVRAKGMTAATFVADARLAVERAAHRLMSFPGGIPLATAAYRAATKARIVTGSSSPEELGTAMPSGFFAGMGARQAIAAARALGELDRNVAHRRGIAEIYESQLRPHGGVLPKAPAGSDPVFVRYPVRVANKERALREAHRRGVELGSWFESPLHPAETNLEAHGYTPGTCPVAEVACRETVNLPTHSGVTAPTAGRAVRAALGQTLAKPFPA